MAHLLEPFEFLAEIGIKREQTTLICVIDEVMKQPDLSYLMSEYAKYVCEYEKSKNNQS